MSKKPLFIDNLQYSNWSQEVFEEMQEAAQCVQPKVILLAVQTILSPDHLEEIEQGIASLTPDAEIWVGGPAHLMERIKCSSSVQKITSLESLHSEFAQDNI